MNSHDYPGLGRIDFADGARGEVDFIFNEVFREREYLQHGIELRPGDTVFDVGANIGLFALFAARTCQQDLSLFCFEPIPETFRWLQANLEHHGLAGSDRVRLFNQGLTRIGGKDTAEFTYFQAAPGNSTMFPQEKADARSVFQRWLKNPSNLLRRVIQHNPLRLPIPSLTYRLLRPFFSRQLKKLDAAYQDLRTVSCRLTTLADVCREHAVSAIDLLKIDVEGAELEVLEGMDNAAWQLTRQVVMEAHDTAGRVGRIQALLQAHGFAQLVITQPTWAQVLELNVCNIYARRDT